MKRDALDEQFNRVARDRRASRPVTVVVAPCCAIVSDGRKYSAGAHVTLPAAAAERFIRRGSARRLP